MKTATAPVGTSSTPSQTPPSTVHRPPSTADNSPSTVHRPPPTADSSPSTAARPRPPGLTTLEAEIIDLFVQLSRLLGQPRSLGELYGLLFISAQPLVMEQLIARLQLSKGSASQGLRYLQTLGAVRAVYVPGDRRTHYAAVAELRVLVSRFLGEQVLPHLENGLRRLDAIAAIAKQLPPAEQAAALDKIQILQTWERKGRRVLPFVTKMLSVGK